MKERERRSLGCIRVRVGMIVIIIRSLGFFCLNSLVIYGFIHFNCITIRNLGRYEN